MGSQGRAFTEQEVQRIVSLLSNTEMTIPEIAARMHCSRSAVLSVNRRRQVRDYNGYRSKWERIQREPSHDELPGTNPAA